MRADGIDPPMPPVPDQPLIGYLIELGPVEPAGMDRAPIGWPTISEWQRLTGVELEPWQARMLRRLSSDFLAESRKAEKPDCPAPWSMMTAEQRAVIDAKIRAAFGALARR